MREGGGREVVVVVAAAAVLMFVGTQRHPEQSQVGLNPPLRTARCNLESSPSRRFKKNDDPTVRKESHASSLSTHRQLQLAGLMKEELQ